MPDTVHHVMWYTVYDAKKKSLPVHQHGQAQRVMSFAAHHHKNSTSYNKVQGGFCENDFLYCFVAEPRIHLPWLATEQEVIRMCVVEICGADGRFINEILVRSVLEGQKYADQLAAETPSRIYNVIDENRRKVYSR